MAAPPTSNMKSRRRMCQLRTFVFFEYNAAAVGGERELALNRLRKRSAAMSQLGQKRRFERRPITSGVPPTPDILGARRHVSKVPDSDIAQLFDHLISNRERPWRQGKAERFRGLEIDYQLKLSETSPTTRALSENEIGCARISMMVRSTNAPCNGRIQMRKTTLSIYSHSACNARPVHTGQKLTRRRVVGPIPTIVDDEVSIIVRSSAASIYCPALSTPLFFAR